MLQKPDVVGHAISALSDTAETAENTAVHLSGIGLPAHREAVGKAELRRDTAVHLVDLFLVAVEQLHEAGFGAGGAPAAQEAQRGQQVIQLLHVRQKVLHPEGGALAHGHRLRRLVVGIAQRGRGGVFLRKGRQIPQHRQQLRPQIGKAVPVQDQIGVVGHIAAGGAQMDDARRRRRGLAVGVHMRHHIMAHLALPPGGLLVVNIGDVSLQL